MRAMRAMQFSYPGPHVVSSSTCLRFVRFFSCSTVPKSVLFIVTSSCNRYLIVVSSEDSGEWRVRVRVRVLTMARTHGSHGSLARTLATLQIVSRILCWYSHLLSCREDSVEPIYHVGNIYKCKISR